jgi:uridine phosphorylase
MARTIEDSELILNKDGSIYHLHLHPDQIADTILTVGDPARVAQISQYFDRIDEQVKKREFVTHTGELNGHRLTVISTGIGPDNIDIVLNELDALVNIDLKKRQVRPDLRSLNLIRVGTSGSVQPDITVDSLVASQYGIGLDNLLAYYPESPSAYDREPAKSFQEYLVAKGLRFPALYSAPCSDALLQRAGKDMIRGITLTSPGFYGPQGRQLRLPSLLSPTFFEQVIHFKYEDLSITNFEMETSGIYGLAHRLGHRALSVNAILANRANKTFSKDPKASVNGAILKVLENITQY